MSLEHVLFLMTTDKLREALALIDAALEALGAADALSEKRGGDSARTTLVIRLYEDKYALEMELESHKPHA